MNIKNQRQAIWLLAALLIANTFVSNAFAAIAFVSASNSASLVDTIDEGDQRVFVFGGIADGESTDLAFSVDSDCPGVAMTGGAEFASTWSCSGGVITASVTNRGGMSFGPATDANQGTFYVTFNDPPAPPGLDAAPAELFGIQISVFGDISSWNLSGEMTESGALFGVELTGSKGGSANFRMYLPQAAVDFLGGVLGVYVGGKPDPFASVSVNDDGSVALSVDISQLGGAAGSSSRVGPKATTVTKKITAGARVLGVAFNKTSVKSGKSVALAMCAGSDFVVGDKVPLTFTLGGKATTLKKSFTIDSSGCAQANVKLKSVAPGSLTAKIKYKGSKAKSSIKVTK